jgi:hypothetical protein
MVNLLLGWLVIYLLLFWALGVFENTYFLLGPNESFRFLGVQVDTWSKYAGVMIFQVISVAMEICTGDIVWPWIITNVQDDTKTMLPYSRVKSWYIVQAVFFYGDVRQIFSIFLSLSQVDLALVAIVESQVITYFWTKPHWLAGKTGPDTIH